MTELKLHSTANLAKCKGCGGEFSALWGKTQVHALSGMGLCDSCKKTAEGAKTVTKPPPKLKLKKKKDKAGELVEGAWSESNVETGPVQSSGG